jgi:hypothetical protein
VSSGRRFFVVLPTRRAGRLRTALRAIPVLCHTTRNPLQDWEIQARYARCLAECATIALRSCHKLSASEKQSALSRGRGIWSGGWVPGDHSHASERVVPRQEPGAE